MTGRVPAESAQGTGRLIDPGKLLEQIGAGGSGMMFMAEQERPLRRRVALKRHQILIRGGHRVRGDSDLPVSLDACGTTRC